MKDRRSPLFSVLWRVAVMLAIFNPLFSLSHWALIGWDLYPGVVLIVMAVAAVVVLYMLSLAREFPGVTVTAVIVIAAVIAGCTLQGWLDPFDLGFWQWAAPVLAGVIFAAGPIYNIVRHRESGVVGSDETPG